MLISSRIRFGTRRLRVGTPLVEEVERLNAVGNEMQFGAVQQGLYDLLKEVCRGGIVVNYENPKHIS